MKLVDIASVWWTKTCWAQQHRSRACVVLRPVYFAHFHVCDKEQVVTTGVQVMAHTCLSVRIDSGMRPAFLSSLAR